MTSVVIASRFPAHRSLCAPLEAAGFEVTFVDSPEALAAGGWRATNPRYVFFPHWSHRIPAEIHEHHECVIFHMADLPHGRGGSPIQNQIAEGLESTMLCALRCVEEMDAGPVYLRRPVSLLGTIEEILQRAAREMVPMMLEIATRHPQPVPQTGDVKVYRRRRPEDGNLASATTLQQVFDTIRMLDGAGYPPAFVDAGPLRLEFGRASLKDGHVVADVRIRLRSDE